MRSTLAGLRTLVLPWGQTTGPRIVLSGDSVPAELVAASPNYTWTAAIVEYVSTTDYRFQAVGTYLPGGLNVEVYAEGTYDTTHGVLFGMTLFGISAAVPIYQYGSDDLNGTALEWLYQKGRFLISSTVTETQDLAAQQLAGDIDRYQPGFPGTYETWHLLTGTYQNGWSDAGGGFSKGQYRRVASPARSVQLIGRLTPGTRTAGTLLFTLPGDYVPATTSIHPVTTDVSLAGGQTPTILVNGGTGQVTVFGLGATCTFIAFNIVYPLDAT